jgi:hypothetical protein
MSTVTVQTISNGTVSTSSANVIQGSAKAWVNFNGSGGTIRASYNVSSITVNGTGDYTVNFTNAFADTNYAAVYGAGFSGASDNSLKWAESASPATYSTTAIRLYNVGSTLGNSTQNSVAIFR